MEYVLEKESFLDDVRNIRSTRRKKQPERTEGFIYLHDTITKSLFDGKGFHIDDIDFSKFTFDDLCEYSEFYDSNLSKKIRVAGTLFGAVEKAGATFMQKHSFQ